MVVKEYSSENFEELSSLLKEHGTIARRDLDDFSFEYLKSGLENPKIKTFCAFVNNTMTSFMISNMLTDHPSWFVRLVCAKKSTFFNPKKTGICSLYDATILYWEKRNVTSFLYVQPYIFMAGANSKTRSGSMKLQEYTPINYQIVPATTQSEYPFIRSIMKNKTFPDDMIVRWCFKNEK